MPKGKPEKNYNHEHKSFLIHYNNTFSSHNSSNRVGHLTSFNIQLHQSKIGLQMNMLTIKVK
jgi:hypothetical protein